MFVLQGSYRTDYEVTCNDWGYIEEIIFDHLFGMIYLV